MTVPAFDWFVVVRICNGSGFPKVHAADTEAYLHNKSLADESVIQGALNTLGTEIQPDIRPPEAEPAYRRQLTKSLLYKV